jgi:hypothetical protein
MGKHVHDYKSIKRSSIGRFVFFLTYKGTVWKSMVPSTFPHEEVLTSSNTSRDHYELSSPEDEYGPHPCDYKCYHPGDKLIKKICFNMCNNPWRTGHKLAGLIIYYYKTREPGRSINTYYFHSLINCIFTREASAVSGVEKQLLLCMFVFHMLRAQITFKGLIQTLCAMFTLQTNILDIITIPGFTTHHKHFRSEI